MRVRTVAEIAAALLVGLCVGALLSPRADAQGQRPVVSVQQPAAGRYQIVVSPHLQAETYLLDTQTGKTWKRIKYTDLEDEPVVWEIQDRADNQGELQTWWHAHTPKKTGH